MRKYTFSRWFKHLIAYNQTAINLKAWKLKYIMHDIDKPVLNLFKSNEYVKNYHRTHSKHHVEYSNIMKQDYIAMVIDWECSNITKPDKPLNAVATYNKYYKNIMTQTQRAKLNSALKKLGLI